MGAFDLRQFEKIAEDEDTATLKHPKGHTIVIAVKALPKIQREAIKRLKLSKGGGVSEQGRDIRFANKSKGQEKEMAQDFAKEEARGRAKFERDHVKPKMQGLAEGGEVKKPVDKFEEKLEKEIFPKYKNPELAKKGYEEMKRRGNEIIDRRKQNKYAKGGDVQYYADDPDLVEPATDAAPDNSNDQKSLAAPNGNPITINVGAQPPQAPPQQSLAMDQMAAPVSAKTGKPMPVVRTQDFSPPPEPPQAPPEPGSGAYEAQLMPSGEGIEKRYSNENSMLRPDETANVPQASKLEQKALEQQANIEAERSGMESANADLAARERFIEAQRDQANIQELSKHTDDFAKHMAENNWGINENKYLDEMGTGKKVATALGLFFGGLSVPFGGHNFAQDFLDKQIDRNIDAQKKRSENMKTVWGAYKDLYGSEQIANNLTKVSTIDMMNLRAKNIAARLGTPQAIQKYNQLKADLMFKRQDALQNAAMMKGALDRGQGVQNKESGKQRNLVPDDKKWGDMDLRPGGDAVPKSNPPPQVNIDVNRMNRSQMLGARGVPGNLSPAEVGAANQAADLANSTNQAIKEVHKQFEDLWKNADNAQDAQSWISHQGLGGLHLPDTRNWDVQNKRYFTAASAVTKQIANIMKGGGSDELYKLISDQLIRGNDRPSDYRKKLENLDNIMRQQLSTTVLKKYNLADGLPE